MPLTRWKKNLRIGDDLLDLVGVRRQLQSHVGMWADVGVHADRSHHSGLSDLDEL